MRLSTQNRRQTLSDERVPAEAACEIMRPQHAGKVMDVEADATTIRAVTLSAAVGVSSGIRNGAAMVCLTLSQNGLLPMTVQQA
jgi:hypothetical protein